MPGGKFQSPLFKPYALYGTVDYVYGWPAYNASNGFTAAQASLNLLETIGYVGYLWIVWRRGEGGKRIVIGGWGGMAVLVGFAMSVMTLSKTILYRKSFSFVNTYIGEAGGQSSRHGQLLILSEVWMGVCV